MPLSLTIKKVDGKPGQVYYPLQLDEVPKPVPGPGEILHLYPGIGFTPLLCDGCGTVVELGPDCKSSLLHKSVLIVPIIGWDADPDAPENIDKYTIIGASSRHGAAQEYIVVRESKVKPYPEHLSPVEGTALPLCGLTGWRALVNKSRNALPGRNIFVMGIGGGVASQIETAVKLGAKGGLQKLLPAGRRLLGTVIDGAGGDILAKVARVLKPGGTICSYGMTVAPKMEWTMQGVLKHIDILGCTTGSRAEFKQMLDFVSHKKIKPVVSRVVTGLDNIEAIDELFQELKRSRQFGKPVIEIEPTKSRI
ncbi:hypothetical protein F4678DRAFT_470056 [Xylaria arbuscula]|nr:hypothetical protein F4678DRAFT_470056 [Xylaria arbuscula]